MITTELNSLWLESDFRIKALLSFAAVQVLTTREIDEQEALDFLASKLPVRQRRHMLHGCYARIVAAPPRTGFDDLLALYDDAAIHGESEPIILDDKGNLITNRMIVEFVRDDLVPEMAARAI